MRLPATYIVYNDKDEFVELGTAEELSGVFNLTPVQIRQRATDSKRREEKHKPKRSLRFYSAGSI